MVCIGRRDPILIVGLGNPGAAFVNTRHNLGQFVVDSFARKHSLKWVTNKRLNAELSRGSLDGAPFILAKPLSNMNLSGYPVRRLVDYFHIQPGRAVIVYDDINVPLMGVKITVRRGDGGHRGMADVCEKLENCLRFRVGIGQKPLAEMDLKDFVLGKFSDEEQAALVYAMPHIFDELEKLVLGGGEKFGPKDRDDGDPA